MAQLKWASVPMAEIASMDTYQLAWVHCRRRDKSGNLVRRFKDEDLPPWVDVDSDGMRVVSEPQPYSQMFFGVERYRGRSADEAKRNWMAYLRENPGHAQLLGVDLSERQDVTAVNHGDNGDAFKMRISF